MSRLCVIFEKICLVVLFAKWRMLEKNFVFYSKTNTKHEYWRKNWNGIFPGMFDTDEWLQYLLNNGEKELHDLEHRRIYRGKTDISMINFFED